MKGRESNKAQRKLLADKLMDLANFAVLAFVFGQVVAPQGPVRVEIIIAGVLIYLVLLLFSLDFEGD